MSAIEPDVLTRHPLRELKSGHLGLLGASACPELEEERLLDLIGFALIGRGAHVRQRAAHYALAIGHELDISPYMELRHADAGLLEAAARAVARA